MDPSSSQDETEVSLESACHWPTTLQIFLCLMLDKLELNGIKKRVEIFFPGFGKARFGNRDRMAENVINCGEN